MNQQEKEVRIEYLCEPICEGYPECHIHIDCPVCDPLRSGIDTYKCPGTDTYIDYSFAEELSAIEKESGPGKFVIRCDKCGSRFRVLRMGGDGISFIAEIVSQGNVTTNAGGENG